MKALLLSAALLAVLATAHNSRPYVDFTEDTPGHVITDLGDDRVHLKHDVHHVYPEHGTFFKAQYEGVLHKKWHFVHLHDHADFESQVICGADDSTLQVKNPSKKLQAELAKQNFQWTLLVAHARHTCVGAQGEDRTIMRGVLSATMDTTTNTLALTTLHMRYEDIFEHLDLSIDTNHMIHQLREHDHQEDHPLPDLNQEVKTTSAEENRGMGTQSFLKKLGQGFEKVAKKTVNVLKKVTTTIVKKVDEGSKKVSALAKGNFDFGVKKFIGESTMNGDVAKRFNKWQIRTGPFKLAASTHVRLGFAVKASVKSWKVQSLTLYMYGMFKGGVRCALSASASYSGFLEGQHGAIETELAIAEINLAQVTFTIGPVPCLAVFTLPISIGADVELSGKLNLNFLFAAAGTVKLGTTYSRSKGMKPIDERKLYTQRDFSPRAQFKWEIGVNLWVLLLLKVNFNMMGGVQAGVQLTAQNILQNNRNCDLYLTINFVPSVVLGGQIEIGAPQMPKPIFEYGIGPFPLVSYTINIDNFCLLPKTKTAKKGRTGSHTMLLQSIDNAAGDDITAPTNVEPVTVVHPDSVEPNATSMTWDGEARCLFPGTTYSTHVEASIMYSVGNYSNQTEVIVSLKNNVTVNYEDGVDPETGLAKFWYEITNVQYTYLMTGSDLTPGQTFNLTRHRENPDSEYSMNTSSSVLPVVDEMIWLEVGKDITQVTARGKMFCTGMNLFSKTWNNDNSTFTIFASGESAEGDDKFLSHNTALIFAIIGGVSAAVIIVVVVAILTRRNKSAPGGGIKSPDYQLAAANDLDESITASRSVNSSTVPEAPVQMTATKPKETHDIL